MVQMMNGRRKWLRTVNVTIVGLIAALAAVACGSKVSRTTTGGETGFLEACGSDADCQSGLCACGVCSKTCEETTDCGDGRVTCFGGKSPACDGESRLVCLLKETSSDVTAGHSTASATDGAHVTDVGECRGKGHYEAGKEGSYLPCCAGLTEVFQLSPAEGDDGPVCIELPLRVYACVEGTCGDGVCEVGEDVACGCVDDCPGAAWGAVLDGGSNTSCADFTCDVELLSSSVGSVNVSLEVEGTFCPLQFTGGSALKLHHVASGKPVTRGRSVWCEGEQCPLPPPPVAPSPDDTSPFVWDGSVVAPDGTLTCETPPGGERPCQTKQSYAPPDRYLARACSYCDGQGEVCAEVEFEFPQSEEVVIRMNNPWSPSEATDGMNGGFDTGPGSDSTAEIQSPQ